jgi:murein L,D-transpeptidase YafK
LQLLRTGLLLIAVTAFGCLPAPDACAFEIALKDVASDRVERQRAFYLGQSTLPGTPDLTRLDERLAAKGVLAGAHVMIRIFKVESELELWMRSGDRFVLFATYPVCHWSGTIGPKIREGDKQAPEGFYSVALKQTRLVGQWRRAFNVGFPNPLDQLQSRTGSNILVHGGCSSVGCFAMTNPVMDEIFHLLRAALKGGQDRVQVHIFPFRMTPANMELHKDSPWIDGWRDLQAGFDLFEATRVPPHVAICDRRYVVRDGRISRPEAVAFQVLAPRPGAGTDSSRCLADETVRVAGAGDFEARKRDDGHAAAEIVTGSVTPSEIGPHKSETEPPPASAVAPVVAAAAALERGARAGDVSRLALPTSATRTGPPPAHMGPAGETSRAHAGPLTGKSPAVRARGTQTVPASAPAPAARAEAAAVRKRVRTRGERSASASSDLSDRPEFVAVRRGAP